MDERDAERLTSDTEIHSLKEGRRRAHLCRNISRLGCMISDEGLAAATGECIEIELPHGLRVAARVIWARQGHIGLAFKEEVSAETVRHLTVFDQTVFPELALRDRFGRFLPAGLGRHAA